MEYDGMVLESWTTWTAYSILDKPNLRQKVGLQWVLSVDKPICFDLLRHCACAFDMDIPPLQIPQMICSDCYVLNWISLMIGVFILEPVEIPSMEHGEEHSELLCHYYIKGGFATSRTLLHTLGW
jgi:hypothetical protein